MDPGSIWYSNTCCWRKASGRCPIPRRSGSLGHVATLYVFPSICFTKLMILFIWHDASWLHQMPFPHADDDGRCCIFMLDMLHLIIVCHSPFWLRLKAKQCLFFLKLLSSWWLGSGFRCLKVRNSIQKIICRIPCAIY